MGVQRGCSHCGWGMQGQNERGLRWMMVGVIALTIVALEVFCRVFSQGMADLLEVWR